MTVEIDDCSDDGVCASWGEELAYGVQQRYLASSRLAKWRPASGPGEAEGAKLDGSPRLAMTQLGVNLKQLTTVR